MRLALLALALAGSLATGAGADQAPAAAPPATPPLTPSDVVLKLDPGARPTPPAGAARPGAPAVVGGVCRVQPDGRLGDCRVMEERPAGRGLGAWLLQTFSHASVGTAARDGSPTAGRLFAFRAQVQADAAAPPKS